MAGKLVRNETEDISEMIYTVRGQKVILDRDLSAIYGVSTKALNQAVKRNADRFPDDFAFQLTSEEAADFLKPQKVTSDKKAMRSQNVTASKRNVRFRPYAFTEHGAIMAANVLRSPRAVKMSVFVVRAFVKMRRLLGDTRELARQLADLEKELKERLDVHEVAIVGILQRVMNLIDPPEFPAPPRKQIGFKVKEKAARYRVTKRSTKSC
jgi:hypothetical protein